MLRGFSRFSIYGSGGRAWRCGGLPCLFLKPFRRQPYFSNLVEERSIADLQILRSFSAIPAIRLQSPQNQVAAQGPARLACNLLEGNGTVLGISDRKRNITIMASLWQ